MWDVDRLERHGRQLADNSGEFVDTRRLNLGRRLRSNANALESAYAAIVAACTRAGHHSGSAMARRQFPRDIGAAQRSAAAPHTPGMARPSRRESPGRTGWPRIFHIATEYLRHTLWEFNPQSLQRLLTGYQNAAALKMREIWALYPILRIALIDELRRIAVRVEDSLAARRRGRRIGRLAAGWRMVGTGRNQPAPTTVAGRPFHRPVYRPARPPPAWHGERGRPLLDDLSRELARRGTTIDDYIQRQHTRRSASNLAARNIITSLRALTSFDWRSLFESTSHVELLLRTQSTYVSCDRRTRDRYRNCVEELATATHRHEVTVTQQILELLGTAQPADLAAADLGSWLIGPKRHELEIFPAVSGFHLAPAQALDSASRAGSLPRRHRQPLRCC